MANDATDRDPIISIRGEQVGLGPLDLSMLPAMTRWINDFATARMLTLDPVPMTEQQERQRLEAASSGKDQIVFAIYDLTDMAASPHGPVRSRPSPPYL